jgi:hypothetical protein
LDVIGSRIIEAERKRKGLLSLEETGRPPDHIQLAAERGVGVIEIDQIDLKRIALG